MKIEAGRAVANKERVLIRMVQEGLWCITLDGSIWRVAVKRFHKSNGSRSIHAVAPVRIERQYAEYLTVQANVNRKVTNCLAHRLVWQHFHGDIPDGLWINHIDGDKRNNSPTNLELVTHSDNLRHAFAIGLASNKGERSPTAKLTNGEAALVRARLRAGEKGKHIARELGVSESLVSLIKRNKTYVEAV